MTATHASLSASRVLRVALQLYGMYLVIWGGLGALSMLMYPEPVFVPGATYVGVGVALLFLERRLVPLAMMAGRCPDSVRVCYVGAGLCLIGAVQVATSVRVFADAAYQEFRNPTFAEMERAERMLEHMREEALGSVPPLVIGTALFFGGFRLAAWWGRRNAVPV